MPRTLLAIGTMIVIVLAAAGCGSSTKDSSATSTTTAATSTSATQQSAATSQPSGPQLTHAQLVAKGDAICYRLNARRASTTISTPGDYKRLVPALAAYELAGVAEMRKLNPPASMANSWKEIADSMETIAKLTGSVDTYQAASNDTEQHKLDAPFTAALNTLVNTAKREGFKDCAQFA